MPLSTVIAGAVAVLQSVTGIGQVHAYVRRIVHRDKILSLLQPNVNGVVNVWFVTREATQATSPDGNSQLFEDRHTVVVEGFYSMVDASATETTFQDLVEAIRVAFRRDQSLGSNPSIVAGPASVRVVDHAQAGNVLCHHAILTLPVVEYAVDPFGGP